MTDSGVNGKSIALLGVSALAIAICQGMQEKPAIAQLIPDDTLGSESSIVTPLDGLVDRIDGGAVRGSNLFHSFQEFNIDAGREAFFDNPAAVENILTRVTGGNPSEIFGTLGVLGDANLFLVNPSGIVFGPDARLDVGGSFFASTAGGVLFRDGYEFSATNTDAPPLLTINVPIGLQFGANPGGIVNQSQFTPMTDGEDSVVGLQVPLGETLGLVGGEIALQGGNVTAQSGRVELGSVGANSTVSLTPIASGFALGYEGVESFQDIQLVQEALVDTSGESGGDVQVRANRLHLQDGGAIIASTSGEGRAGILDIHATESVELSGTNADGTSGSRVFANTEGLGNGGEINIDTGRLSVRDGGIILISSGDRGGILNVNATESVELMGTTPDGTLGSGLFALSNSLEDGGTIDINTGRLIVRDGATIQLVTNGEGFGGTLRVNASESVEVLGTARVPNIIETESFRIVGRLNSTLTSIASGSGDGGTIDINTGRLIVRDGANISVFTSDEGGEGGTLRINASESVEVIGVAAEPREVTIFQPEGEPIVSTQTLSSNLATATNGIGDAGEIAIDTGRLRLQDGAEIFLSSLDRGAGGRGGRLTVNASESVELTGTTPDGTAGSDVIASTRGLGDAGDVTINTGRLLLEDGAQILLTTANREAGGRGGTLIVNATESVELIGTTTVPQTQEVQLNETELLRSTATSTSSLDVATLGEGDAGEITVRTGRLSVRDGAGMFATTGGSGRGGTITVNATESVEVIGAAAIPDEITLVRETESGQRILTDIATSFSSLSASSTETGDAGDITVRTGQLRVRDGANIALDTGGQGQGGTLVINASESVELSGNLGNDVSFLQAITTGGGNAGEIFISTERLSLRDGGSIFTNTLGSGSGGTVTVNATESIEVLETSPDGLTGGLFASTLNQGDGGSVTVDTESLRVADGAEISVNSRVLTLEELTPAFEFLGVEISETVGNPGSIDITADDVRLENGGLLDAVSSTGQGGNIDVRARDIRLRQGLITASGRGNDPTLDGNIDLSAETLVLLDNSEIITSSTDPQGGSNIRFSPIDGENGSLVLLQSPDSLINAEGELVIEGELDPDPAEVPDLDTIDAASLLGTDFCSQRRESEFIYTGRGGIPPQPTDPASPTTVWQDWSLTEIPETPTTMATPGETRVEGRPPAHPTEHPPLVEAQGWIADEAGNIILTAEPYRGTPHPLALQPIECQDGDRFGKAEGAGEAGEAGEAGGEDYL